MLTRSDNSVIHHFKHVRTLHFSNRPSIVQTTVNVSELGKEEFYDFIQDNPSMIRLKVLGVHQRISMTKPMNILPFIVETQFNSFFSIDEIAGFMKSEEIIDKNSVPSESISNFEFFF